MNRAFTLCRENETRAQPRFLHVRGVRIGTGKELLCMMWSGDEVTTNVSQRPNWLVKHLDIVSSAWIGQSFPWHFRRRDTSELHSQAKR